MRNFNSQDGEAEILIPAMREEVQAAFQAVFQEAKTDFVKGPPSATAKHQANDVNAAFRDSKAGVATVTRYQINTSNHTLAEHVKKAVNELKVAFPSAVVTSPNIAKLIAAVEALTFVQKNGCVSTEACGKLQGGINYPQDHLAYHPAFIVLQLLTNLGLWPARYTRSFQHKKNHRRLRQCDCLRRDEHAPVLLPHN